MKEVRKNTDSLSRKWSKKLKKIREKKQRHVSKTLTSKDL
jgi:hypothetical protein